MQPFETQSENPKPQAKITYPTLDSAPQQGQNPQPQEQNLQPQGQYTQYQGQYPQPQGQYPQPQGQYPQPQGQYPQPQGQYPQQRPSYPNYQQQRPSQQPYPQNYQAPYPNQAYQQPGGYPNYQAQPQYVMYSQGGNQGSNDVQKIMLAQQLNRSRDVSGKGLVIFYSLFVAAASVGIAYVFINQTSYQILLNVYEKIAGRAFNPSDSFSRDTCQAFLADIIAVPIFLFAFAAFNFFAMLVSCAGISGCMFIQPLCALVWAGIAVFVSQQQCVGYSILTTMFGANNVPQNAWTYYGAMSAASLLSCFLNWSWSSNEDKAKRDQRNLALMMAAS